MSIILGLNAFHGDASACVFRDGELIAAAEEERFCRRKHAAGFPKEAIRYCLAEAGVGLDSVTDVAINSHPRAAMGKKLAYALLHRPNPRLLVDRLRNARRRAGLDELLRGVDDTKFAGKIHRIEHHQAHLASTFLVSSFERALAVSVDGFGDFASAAWGLGAGNHIHVQGRVYFPHSLGIFYQAVTQWLGFPNYGDEYKVMGLASFGAAAFAEEMCEIVRLRNSGAFELNLPYFRHHRERVEYRWDDGVPVVGRLFSDRAAELLGKRRAMDEPLEQRHKDLARSTQARYEQVLFHLLNHLHTQYGEDHLVLAGGCAMNSVANGKILANTPFTEVFVQPAAGDAGGALGAALAVWHASGERERQVMTHAAWGPQFANGEIAAAVEQRRNELGSAGCHVEVEVHAERLCHETARAIATGEIVGWFQGRMEWGPRALGNRSILCDPRRKEMRDVLNNKIKLREPFRPFAPSILREAVPDWFETDDDVPFMMKVYPIRSDKRSQIPAVTHVDGTGRLQTVTSEANPLYYRLISAFRDATGIPIVLNTSFNENEPIVCRPEEALDTFLRTRMDRLVLGSMVITRSS